MWFQLLKVYVCREKINNTIVSKEGLSDYFLFIFSPIFQPFLQCTIVIYSEVLNADLISRQQGAESKAFRLTVSAAGLLGAWIQRRR